MASVVPKIDNGEYIMPADFLNTWSPASKVAAHEALVAMLDAHVTDPAFVTIHDSSDVTLAVILLEKPSGTVTPGTGRLALITNGREEDATAGTASYATLRDGYGDPYTSLLCEQGTTPVPGACVLNTLGIVGGTPVDLVSFEVE